MKMNGPFVIELKVYAIDKSRNKAIVTLALPSGIYAKPETIKEFIGKAKEALPDDFRLMNKSEFFNTLIVEEHGPQSSKYATPGDEDFDEQESDSHKLNIITEAIAQYHQALTNREHGGVAQDKAIKKIETILGKHWNQSQGEQP